MTDGVARFSAATSWPTWVVWETPYAELEGVLDELSRRSNRSFARPMRDRERRQRDEARAHLKTLGLR